MDIPLFKYLVAVVFVTRPVDPGGLRFCFFNFGYSVPSKVPWTNDMPYK